MGGVFPPRCRVYFGANHTTLGQELASVWGPGRFTRKAFSKVPKAFEQRPVRRSHCYECGAVVCVRADLWLWVRVRYLQTWFAEIVKPGNLI